MILPSIRLGAFYRNDPRRFLHLGGQGAGIARSSDLTEEIAAFEARLVFDADANVSELTVEIAGIITPTMGPKPAFYPLVGASLAALEVGPDRVAAGIREGEAVF